MKIYLVGGAVRDSYLGLIPNDYDFVVVGSSPREMIDLGYTQVGKDFPVFLHPKSKHEYALARTERKIGFGHHGFECRWGGVTLVEDLARRDLTINSIAVEVEINKNGLIIDRMGTFDPFNGIGDINDKILRATSEAFTEDPLRVLRVAKFLSRLGPEWTIHEYTLEMMCRVSDRGELQDLTPERVWKETESALGSPYPELYFETLRGEDIFPMTQAMEETPQRLDHHPEGDVWTHTKLVLKLAASYVLSPQEVFACYTHDFGKPECWIEFNDAFGHEMVGLPHINDFCNKWRVPNKFRKLALHVCEFHTKIHGCLGRDGTGAIKAVTIMKMFEETGAIKDTEHFTSILNCCKMDAGGRGKGEEQIFEYGSKPYPQYNYMIECLWAAKQTDTKDLVKKLQERGVEGRIIGIEVRAARINAIKKVKWAWR